MYIYIYSFKIHITLPHLYVVSLPFSPCFSKKCLSSQKKHPTKFPWFPAEICGQCVWFRSPSKMGSFSFCTPRHQHRNPMGGWCCQAFGIFLVGVCCLELVVGLIVTWLKLEFFLDSKPTSPRNSILTHNSSIASWNWKYSSLCGFATKLLFFWVFKHPLGTLFVHQVATLRPQGRAEVAGHLSSWELWPQHQTMFTSSTSVNKYTCIYVTCTHSSLV